MDLEKNMVAKYEFLYEKLYLKTNNNTLFDAFRYCDLYKITVTKKMKCDNAKATTLYNDNHPVVQRLYNNFKDNYEPTYNCFGAAVLNKKYLIDLNSHNLECFLKGDNYKEEKKTPKKEHLVVYYKNSEPIHIARYNKNDKLYEHKIGFSKGIKYFTTDNIREFYNYDNKKYYIKQ